MHLSYRDVKITAFSICNKVSKIKDRKTSLLSNLEKNFRPSQYRHLYLYGCITILSKKNDKVLKECFRIIKISLGSVVLNNYRKFN